MFFCVGVSALNWLSIKKYSIQDEVYSDIQMWSPIAHAHEEATDYDKFHITKIMQLPTMIYI